MRRMPDPMTGFYEGPPRAERVEVITSVQRRRRWSTEEKVRIVEETFLPGNSVSLVARRHGIAGNQLFTWRRLMAQGALTAAGKEIRGWVIDAPLQPDLDADIRAAYDKLAAENGGGDIAVAVRSSATAEDLPDASFAGQQETFLNDTESDYLS